ncbi:toxin VasX [Marinobacter halotolerans]|uniref:toxin VasX n=1 Tax=Marinobacter halotolerans TaxID=1569211 RepID=UPI0012485487|nr:toxin VasX [Marinobacter halotolerans]
MTRIQRPADERASSDLSCWEQPGTPIDEPASCPLLKTVHLLPVRYGRVEVAPADTDPGYPYSLTSRPLGYRLLRHGYLYMLDANTGELHEYVHENGELSGHNDGKLEYPKQHTLYVCFTDVPLTERKKAQVLDSQEERAHFMQEIDLASASPLSGGKHLLTPEQAKQWVAEFAEDYTPDAPEEGHVQESEPYHWENQPYYHKTRFGKLIKQQAVEDPDDCLCLVLQDDVGVMLDLAQHQDDVVGWIGDWAQGGEEPGHTERDYMLGAWIESMTLINDHSLEAAGERPGGEPFQELYESTNEAQRQAIYDYLEVRKDYRGPQPMGPETYLRDHHWDNPLVRAQLAMIDALGQATYEQHRDTINQLNLQNYHQLNGAKLGQRGINELIDRPRMDAFMTAQRAKLARWQGLLEDITDDRTNLLCDSRIHQAAWYFDPADEKQLEAALDLNYACLKDLCRSDEAAEKVLAWLEENPQYSHPLFHTLPKTAQAPDAEPSTTYFGIAGAGYSLVTKAAEWARRLADVEAVHLPDLELRSQQIQAKAAAIGDTLAPAVSKGIAQAMEQLYQGIESNRIPSLDDLFRDLPYFFKGKMLKAIQAGEVEFRVASEPELTTFRQNLEQLLALNERLETLTHDHDVAKATHGHKSERAQSIVDEFKATREEQRAVGRRLAGALSPVDETDTGLRLDPADTGRAGISLLLPTAGQQQMGTVMGHIRQGLTSAPRVNLLGDGLGVLVFVAQAVNFWNVLDEVFSDTNSGKTANKFFESLFATAGAGFLAAQSLSDTALVSRAQTLAKAWQRSAVQSVHIQMGRLHVGLGIFAYGAGAISAAIGTYKHANNWLEAVRTGNAEAQLGATLGMLGSGGLAMTNAYGFGRSVQMGLGVVRASDDVAKAAAWATAGTRLSSLFARLNIAGLVFTVFELGGTWLYNRYNLSERDQWLQTTPWSREPGQVHNGSLAEYEQAFARLGNSLCLEKVPAQEEDGKHQLVLNCHALTPEGLIEPLGQPAPRRVWLSAWRIRPERSGWFRDTPETWVRCSHDILTNLDIREGSGHLQLAFLPPDHSKSGTDPETQDLALMVRLDTLHSKERYTQKVYMLKVTPDSDWPVTPVQEPPQDKEGRIFWYQVRNPFMELDIFQ